MITRGIIMKAGKVMQTLPPTGKPDIATLRRAPKALIDANSRACVATKACYKRSRRVGMRESKLARSCKTQ
jgi:hypothetical protein